MWNSSIFSKSLVTFRANHLGVKCEFETEEIYLHIKYGSEVVSNLSTDSHWWPCFSVPYLSLPQMRISIRVWKKWNDRDVMHMMRNPQYGKLQTECLCQVHSIDLDHSRFSKLNGRAHQGAVKANFPRNSSVVHLIAYKSHHRTCYASAQRNNRE